MARKCELTIAGTDIEDSTVSIVPAIPAGSVTTGLPEAGGVIVGAIGFGQPVLHKKKLASSTTKTPWIRVFFNWRSLQSSIDDYAFW